MATETRTANGLTVQRYDIIGTAITVYGAWEPTAPTGRALYAHTTIQTIEGRSMGRVGTRGLTPELHALPSFSDARMDAIDAWHEAQEQEAYAAIIAAFPEAQGGRRTEGQIETF